MTHECAPMDEINEFLKRKKLAFKVIQDKIDFTEFNETLTIRKNEVYS